MKVGDAVSGCIKRPVLVRRRKLKSIPYFCTQYVKSDGGLTDALSNIHEVLKLWKFIYKQNFK